MPDYDEFRALIRLGEAHAEGCRAAAAKAAAQEAAAREWAAEE